MTISDPRYLAPAPGMHDKLVETDGDETDLDADTGPRDSDGVPVGRADVEADIRRSGGDPDAV